MIDCNITENFLKEKRRMCKTYDRCSKCPMDESRKQENVSNMFCREFCEENPKKAIGIVQQWSDDHPKKTMLDDLLEKYPKTILGSDGIPIEFCPKYIGLTSDCKCVRNNLGVSDCVACWNRPFEEE